MKCNLCLEHNIESIALWHVGKQGFCRKHKLEAWAAEAEKQNKRKSASVLKSAFRELEMRAERALR